MVEVVLVPAVDCMYFPWYYLSGCFRSLLVTALLLFDNQSRSVTCNSMEADVPFQ